jgi:hypothetical protein
MAPSMFWEFDTVPTPVKVASYFDLNPLSNLTKCRKTRCSKLSPAAARTPHHGARKTPDANLQWSNPVVWKKL